MWKSTSVLLLLVVAVAGPNLMFSVVGCYPRDYDPTTEAIDPPSEEQVQELADVAAATVPTVAAAAGQPALAPILDLAARLAILIGAWFIARSYKKPKA